MAKSPVNLSKAVDAWKDGLEAAKRSAGVMLGGDGALVALAQEQFASGGTTPATWTGSPADLSSLASVPGELLVLLVKPSEESEALTALDAEVPRGGVVLAVDEGESATGRRSSPRSGVVRLSFCDSSRCWKQLFEACAEVAGEHIVALGRRYPALRQQAARRVIYKAAGQNALIGLTFFIPGTDMPAMTLNQARMLLSLSGIYGAPIDKERALELVGVVGAGFGLRALARSFLRSVPGIGLVIKASTGFTGTVALGYAMVGYFETGAPLATSKVMSLASRLRS